ncbi:hypothetical protein ITP53_44780 [Nonomuraea sp. K274]|uniref:Knr4/Smi1-like domain-containing protein n=1 Tax=Nonomuraea cypriaca TaxID=1187855 RepID=A0A931F614_9ACTN|nr:SMI1/KNR4 family protein [Nonomuraea cypriaca]MBF8192681.1 hypothetical protein [Nonomuraea cypriaca]
MLKLVRLALKAAIVTAIVVRLRRRARMPEKAPVPAPAPRTPARGTRVGLLWAGIAVLVALTLTAAVLPTEAQETAEANARAYQAEQDALTRDLLDTEQSIAQQPTTQQPTAQASPAPDTEHQAALEVPDPNCSPAPRPVTVRPIDPKVKRAVDREWRRIERWLKANAPRTYGTLATPGRARTIAIAESQMGVDFPDDLRASLLRHNGSQGARGFGFGFWPGGAVNLGTREIRDAWRDRCRWDRTDSGTDPATEHWNGRMIPFVFFEGRDSRDGMYGVVDSVEGTAGWDDTFSGMAPRMPSYHALMRAVADALEQGEEIEGWRPAVERGMLRWENPHWESTE